MATGSMPASGSFAARRSPAAPTPAALVWRLVRAAGSLKITVAMFIAATFLLFVGTLAQDEKNLPEVKAEYFNSWVARVPVSDFFPVTIFGPSRVTAWFPFPGGAAIGLILMVNLVAAKLTRFQVAATGRRLLWGTLVSLGGLAMVGAVILTGHRTDGLQGRPPIAYDTVWLLVQAGAVGLAAGAAAAAWRARQRPVRLALGGLAALTGTAALVALAGGEAWRMGDPGLRIMWQLIQSSGASLFLLAGLWLVFGGRGGNVLIHVAVALLMVGQFVFGDRQIEERMSLLEHQTTNMAFRTDETELAVIDAGAAGTDAVTAISPRLLRARAGGAPIAIDGLPFTIQVREFFPNSTVVRVGPVAPNPATTGIGSRWLAAAAPPEGGASSRSNIASAYVHLVETATGRDLGTHLVSQFLNDQEQIFAGGDPDECDVVEAGGRPWRLQLRYRREYKPYDVTLDDVRRIDYSASDTPRDYSSYVRFTDRATQTEQRGRIWMNNPVRYRGETFYQSTYTPVERADGSRAEMTGLQVVENAGWLVPYVACVLAFWGMLAHFGGTFLRFADRREREADRRSTATGRTGGWLAPAAGFALVALVVLPAARDRQPPDTADWTAAGAIPVLHEGRIKPLDSVARTTLQLLGGRTAVTMPETAPAGAPRGRVPAARWLLATMAGSDWVRHAPVFRIDAKEVVDLFDLTRRPGNRYTPAELEPGRAALQKQLQGLRDVPPDQRSFTHKKLLEIQAKLLAFDLLGFAYETPALPVPTGDDEAARRDYLAQFQRIMQAARRIEENHPLAALPPVGETESADRWQALYPALVEAIVGRVLGSRPGQPRYEPNPALEPFTKLLAQVDSPAAEFNAALGGYRRALDGFPAVRSVAGKARFEAWLNGFNPTDVAKWLYVLATVICFAGFLGWQWGWQRPVGRLVSALLLGTFLVHTFALGARIWITGRPPVVNLYSSAVFIGWASVIAGLGLESIHRLGIGNLAAAVAGALTLFVAYGLDTGDTMHVLQAVLDTQFWLSTHVITVTLGYGATFLAGLLGTCSIVHLLWARWVRPGGDAAGRRLVQDRLHQMTYGVVCFALFFSFIGTVLGGLWADDSWGRFWGWDPKENGALMIVLWNAAVLHARWDRWIGPRGFALFTIGGNIVTAWSWFGTNQLGIGLHSYGFTSGVLMLLAGYVVSQFALVVAGLCWARPAATR